MESESEPEPERESLLQLLKKGNTSSAIAMLGNMLIAVIKGIAAMLSGSGTMFASTMHSLADAINQGFVFTGSILAEKKPTRRFPTGFGRVINIFCMVAVIIITLLAYETIREGWHLIQHPVESLIELRPGFSLADADDIKFPVQDKLIADPDITDVMLGIIEDNGVKDWTPEKLNQVK